MDAPLQTGEMGGAAGILTDPAQGSEGMDGGDAPVQPQPGKYTPEQEEKLVAKLWKEYNHGRKFDDNFRKQVAIDRKYAAGTADLSWAVTTNLIGAYIDILVALLYARDPDVSVKKSPQVDDSGTRQYELFARTLEIVISRLWVRGKLKKACRKSVRSTLSCAEGWFKAMMVSEKEPRPELDKKMNDARETLDRLKAQQMLIEDPDGQSPDEIEALIDEKEALISTLQDQVETAVNKMFVIDHVQTENMQVSANVSCVEDYLDADWIGNELFLSKEDALARFKDNLQASDIKDAKLYYQKEPKELTTREFDNALPQQNLTAESAQAFTASASSSESIAFVRVVEIWDQRDKKIRTLIEGVKKFAKLPYGPPYPTSRFYPYFYLAFYEVDGSRHAQSLSWRLYKLQDEYASSRSNFRLTRERSIPGVLFNSSALDEVEARKLSEAKHQEYTGLKPADPDRPLSELFAPKPVASIDIRVFDPTYILNDMERISGVQEALSSSAQGTGNPITATEANVQQMGTNARTSSNRDSEEEMLTDLAQYTAEQALQCLTIRDVQRIAGTKAFWPGPTEDSPGMSIEDLQTLVEVTIKAGTTGKPRAAVDQQAWATILPLIQQMLKDILQALGSGNKPLADSLIELVKETMLRLGDDSDVERFIPRLPPPGSPGAGAPPPPIEPQISISLRGELDPMTAARLAMPAIAQDAASLQPPAPSPSAPGAPVPPGPQPEPDAGAPAAPGAEPSATEPPPPVG